MLKHFTAFLMTLPLLSFAENRVADMNFGIDPVCPKTHHVHFSLEEEIPVDSHFLVLHTTGGVNQRGDLLISLGTGFRKPFEKGELGNYVFFDYSTFKESNLYQLVHQIEFVSEWADIRHTSHLPTSSYVLSTKGLINPHTWMETEATVKFPFVSLSLGPRFNFTNKSWATFARVDVPVFRSILSVGGFYDSLEKWKATVGFKFNLYKDGNRRGHSMGHNPYVKHQILSMNSVL